jgi:acetoin utilization deacetylase AcuC-like enzyme
VNKTGYFFHADCSLHEMGYGHPECPQRLEAIEQCLEKSGMAAELLRREAPPASIADLELAHGRMHIAALRGLTDGLREEMLAGGPTHAQIDPDTSINIHTWNAALHAAGAAFSTTWRWRRAMRWSATALKGWRSSTSTCTTAMARKTSLPVMRAS